MVRVRRVFRWFVIGSLSLLVPVLLAILLVPVFVNIDRYREPLLSSVNGRIDGKLDAGRLKLSLWGQVAVDVDGLVLKTAEAEQVIRANEVRLRIPLLSLLTGHPVVTLLLDSPDVAVVKKKSGQLNIAEALKLKTASTREPVGILFLANSRLGLELRNANFRYIDELKGKETKLRGLNVLLRNLSLAGPIGLEAWADLDAGGVFRGPLKLAGEFQPDIRERKFFGGKGRVNLNFSSKDTKLPMSADVAFLADEKQARINKAVLRLLNDEIELSGNIQRTEPATIDLQFKSNDVVLEPLAQFFPVLTQYAVGGVVRFDGSVAGPADRLATQATLQLKGVSVKPPKLTEKTITDGTIRINNDQIENINLVTRTQSGKVQLNGWLKSFTRPRFQLEVKADRLDLDKLLVAPTDTPKDIKEKKASAPTTAHSSASPSVSVQTPAPVFSAPVSAASGSLKLSVQSLKIYDQTIDKINGNFILKDLSVFIDKLSADIKGGTALLSGAVNIKTPTPTYRFALKAEGLEVKEKIEGVAALKLEGNGAGFDPAVAKKKLVASGHVRFEKASFKNIDVGAMASQAVTQSIDSLSARVPALRGVLSKVPKVSDIRYQAISSDFHVNNGRFAASSFSAKAEPGRGIDLKGEAEIGLVDFSLRARVDVIDTYDLLRTRDVSVQLAGVKVERVLAGRDGIVKFPVSVGCTMTAPCFAYSEVVESLANTAYGNLRRSSAPLVRDAVKDLSKKLFGR